jgi:hypothetical protein
MENSPSNPSDAPKAPPLLQTPSAGVVDPASPPQLLLVCLNLFMLLFLADGVISLIDDSFILLGDAHFLSGLRSLVGMLGFLFAVLVYLLIGLNLFSPKGLFVPAALFNPAVTLLFIPALIYSYRHLPLVSWVFSACQVALILLMLKRMRWSLRCWWPLIPEGLIQKRQFSVGKTCRFLLLNVFVILPAVLVYVVASAGVAIHHFSEGFVSLRSDGIRVQVRKYARDDGKTVLLVPMSHIGEPEFYHSLSESFPKSSTILMEGVTDDQNLLTNRISYRRTAASLGLAAQEKQFKPNPTQIVRADIDVSEFSPNTLGFLNLVMLFHSRGLNAMSVLQLMQTPQPPGFERKLFGDLLGKRNSHLLEVLGRQLSQSNELIVPWGAAHMPGIAQGIQKLGFRPVSTKEYVAIRFGKK